jgi:hypothetical protein
MWTIVEKKKWVVLGCDHYREGVKCNEQKTSKCPKNKSN